MLRRQAEHLALLGSPLYAGLARTLADDPEPLRPVVGDHVGRQLVILRLFGAVHNLVLRGVAPQALSGRVEDFLDAVTEHEAEVRRFVAEQAVQTNETRRCVGLLPAFLTLARASGLPLELLELGPSAGLNLVPDRYGYRYAEGVWGPGDALLVHETVERGTVPAALLGEQLEIRRRRGIDQSPVDVTTEDGALLLQSFIWPGLEERFRRLDAAIATLRAAPHPPELLRGDYVDLLPGLLAVRPADALTVVFQTASTGYVPDDRYRVLREAVDRAGDDGRPLAWVSTRRVEERELPGGDSYELELRLWPEPMLLAAEMDFHGNWLDWLLR